MLRLTEVWFRSVPLPYAPVVPVVPVLSARVAVGGPGQDHVEFISVGPGYNPYRENGNPGGVFDPQLLVDSDSYFGISEFIEGDQELGYPLPPRPSGAPVVSPPELADVALVRDDALDGDEDFTVYFAGTTPEDAWDTTPPPNGPVPTTYTQFPLLSLVTADDSDAWITITASPRASVGNPAVLPNLGVNVHMHDGSTAVGTLGPATWVRGRSLIGVMVYSASQHKLRVSAALSGQRLPDLELPNIDLHGRTFRYIRFGDNHAGTDRKVGSFQWAGVAAEPVAISPARVSRALRTLYFLEPD